MTELQKLIAKDLLSIKAVFFRPEEPFTWASGIKSPVYCDNRLTLTAPKVRCDVENGLATLIKENYLVSLNIIRFMCQRITFLNEKIATFSGDNVEQKLARLLLSDSINTGLDEFKFNKKRAAETINAGRASLYRALDTLSEKGLILLNNKTIKILDRQGLERISK